MVVVTVVMMTGSLHISFSVRVHRRSGRLAAAIFHHHVMNGIVVVRVVHSADVDFAVGIGEIVVCNKSMEIV